MAKAEFILQAVTPENHASAVTDLLQLMQPTRVLFSVAYMREAGLAAIAEAIQPLPEHTEVFVGIRNDLTSVQAVKLLLGLNVRVYAVDTASRQTIYHPKLYLAANDASAGVIVGSANLTFGGMYNNIEVSTVMDLDLTDEEDRQFIDDINTAFAGLIKDHPDHVFLIKDAAQADELFEQGRLADEEVIPAPNTGSGVKKGSRDSLPPMKLNLKVKPKPKVRTPTHPPAPPGGGVVVVVPPAGPPASVPHLVWQSNGLTERDLNVPSGTGTHKTGSMGFKKGAWEMDDLRHYFRDEVFHDLQWAPKATGSKHERATAKFELIVKNLNYGIFELELSHDTDTTSASYEQHNMMTEIKWGSATEYIARRDLLGRVLYLYRKDTDPPEFVIEID